MKKKPSFIILWSLFLANTLVWIGVFQISHANLEVAFFDVGQGDAILTEWTQYIPSYLGLSSLI